MPKYDAFGREVGEDTLAGLGGSERESASDGWTEAQLADAAAAEPAEPPAGFDAAPSRTAFEAPEATPAFEAPEATPARTAFEAAPATTVRVRRRGGAGCLVALVVFGFVAAAPIVAFFGILGSAREAIDEVTDAIDSVPDDVVPDIPDAPEAPPPPPAGIHGESLVARDNFARTLDRIGGMGGATTIRLAPERLNAQLVRRSVDVTFDGSVARGPATGGGAGLAAVPLSAIDPGAPQRLVRGSAARYRVRPRGINYLMMSPAPGVGHVWIAYFKNGIYVQGDRSGRVVRRIN